MARGRAVIIAASIALTAIVALSLLVTAGVEASSADKELASAPVFGGPLLEINPLSIDAVPPAQTILTCTTTITTPNSDVTNNFSIASASSVFLLPYNNLSMMIPGVPTPKSCAPMSCADPAKTMDDIARAALGGRPALRAVTP